MATYGDIIRVVRFEYHIYGSGDLIEDLEYPHEMGRVEKRISSERVGAEGKWRSEYVVKTV